MRAALFSMVVVASLAWPAACTSPDAPNRSTGARSDAGVAPDARAVDLAAIGARRLDSLGGAERTALCEQESRLVDPCLEVALRTTQDPTECPTSLAACRAQEGDGGFSQDCSSSGAGPAGGCSVTVDEYLACATAFGASLTCDLAGRIVSPTDCASLSARCPALASSFHIAGKPLPCTPEESAGKPVHTGDDIYGADGCRPVPARFVVLGDSIANCTGVTGDGCAPDLIVAYLQTHGAPDVVLEMHAEAGAVVADLRPQAEEVQGGPGHVYVWTYAIGNDLLVGNPDGATLVAGYASMFDYFTDSERFPDGATFLLNTQYNPKDECTPPGAMRRPGIDALIRQLNQQVFIDVAEARDDTVAVDQLPDFLGHGDNADITGCPYCGADNTPWLFSIHPNALGHAHIAEKWEVALAAMLGPACGG